MVRMLKIGEQMINLDHVHRTVYYPDSDRLIVVFEPLSSSEDDTIIVWSSIAFYGENAKALLSWLTRNSEKIS